MTSEHGRELGKASAAGFTAKERSTRARAAVMARWAKVRKQQAEDSGLTPAALLAMLRASLPEKPGREWIDGKLLAQVAVWLADTNGIPTSVSPDTNSKQGRKPSPRKVASKAIAPLVYSDTNGKLPVAPAIDADPPRPAEDLAQAVDDDGPPF